MKARVFVTLKRSVFDPQGTAVHDALASLGYDQVRGVRQGKLFELELDAASPEAARATLEELSRRVLANPVIEGFEVEIVA